MYVFMYVCQLCVYVCMYSAEENLCGIFFLWLLISSSSILLSLFDTQTMNCLPRHKAFLYSKRELNIAVII